MQLIDRFYGRQLLVEHSRPFSGDPEPGALEPVADLIEPSAGHGTFTLLPAASPWTWSRDNIISERILRSDRRNEGGDHGRR